MTFQPDWRDGREDFPDDFNALSEDDRRRLMEERVRLLHVYGAPTWHDDIRVVGNRNALTVFRDALSAALDEGKSETSATAADGEGFGITIELNDAAWASPAWETSPPHYIDPVACGKPDPWTAVVNLQHALRHANARLVKRGVKPVPDPTPKDETE